MVYRVIVKKKEDHDHLSRQAEQLLEGAKPASSEPRGKPRLRAYTVYDVEGLTLAQLESSARGILYLPNTDEAEILESMDDFSSARLPLFRYALQRGQYDQRADAAEQCIRLVLPDSEPTIRSSRLIAVCEGEASAEELAGALVNPVDSEVCDLAIPTELRSEILADTSVITVDPRSVNTTLSAADLDHIEAFYRSIGRAPTETEIRVLDTYWSDHCRHTTFTTELRDITFEESESLAPVIRTFKTYEKMRADLGRGDRPITLMDLATIDARHLRAHGGLRDLDESEEINACSIVRSVTDVKGNQREYLIQFKNETHNHPTEIEPFGGAATCLGGAIRDPLSGRSYVYQGVRLSGAGDPYQLPEEKLPGKLLQSRICREAAHGFSSYGNQIGVATGLVDEVYHEGYVAKRMEVGAVIGAVPRAHVDRRRPQPGDVVLLIGGRTGRDGIGGATGSSKTQTQESVSRSGAEVQKGNAPEERKLQRLFRNPEFSRRVVRCNDFGAGGVCVAIGELADSLEIYLDRVPLKYSGLTPTEIAISESQERMAVVLKPADRIFVEKLCREENLEATFVARVTDSGRMVMKYFDDVHFDLPRSFIDTNGAGASASLRVRAVIDSPDLLKKSPDFARALRSADSGSLLNELFDTNNAAKKGLIELFDNTIGAGTVLLPFGGKHQDTPAQVACAKIPADEEENMTASLMSYGFQPDMSVSPYYMGIYSVTESIAKIAAAGGDYRTVRLSLQEYFPKIGDHNRDLPFLALLGAGEAMRGFGTAAIGGKDSMSGTYGEISVPPTLISFAVTTEDAARILTGELKSHSSHLYLLGWEYDGRMPRFDSVREDYERLYELAGEGKILSAYGVTRGGVASAAAKMALGSGIGVRIEWENPHDYLYGAIVVESCHDLPFRCIGRTENTGKITVNGRSASIAEARERFNGLLSELYPDPARKNHTLADLHLDLDRCDRSDCLLPLSDPVVPSVRSEDPPRVFIPVFPGTNCEYDTVRAFRKAGAQTEVQLFVNLDAASIAASIDRFERAIDCCDILMLSGGFSAGDEPDGSAKYIASVLRNERLKNAVHRLLDRDGLILGVCNGFQALVKLGLLPYGRIREIEENDPVLAVNQAGHHIAAVVPVTVRSNRSPWLRFEEVGQVTMTPFSHGEGRFYISAEGLEQLRAGDQIATTYGQPGFNGSVADIEGIISPDGRIFGKMGHIERVGHCLYKNLPLRFDNRIIEAGVDYAAKRKSGRK